MTKYCKFSAKKTLNIFKQFMIPKTFFHIPVNQKEIHNLIYTKKVVLKSFKNLNFPSRLLMLHVLFNLRMKISSSAFPLIVEKDENFIFSYKHLIFFSIFKLFLLPSFFMTLIKFILGGSFNFDEWIAAHKMNMKLESKIGRYLQSCLA